jgi:hypothetical protein
MISLESLFQNICWVKTPNIPRVALSPGAARAAPTPSHLRPPPPPPPPLPSPVVSTGQSPGGAAAAGLCFSRRWGVSRASRGSLQLPLCDCSAPGRRGFAAYWQWKLRCGGGGGPGNLRAFLLSALRHRMCIWRGATRREVLWCGLPRWWWVVACCRVCTAWASGG